MKRIIPFIAAVLVALSAQAQTVNVHMADGTTQNYDAFEVDYIDFSEGIGFKATVSIGASQKALKFAEGDQLLIKGENVSGLLQITSGAGTKNGEFEGTVNYKGVGTPASNLALTATLISSTNVGVNTRTGAISYDGAICSTLDEAVAKYCLLTGQSTFGSGQPAFTLNLQTAYLRFTATLPEGYPDGYADEPVTVTVGGIDYTGKATISVEGTNAPVAKFVLPVAVGTLLSNSKVKVGRFAAADFGSGTTQPKAYDVDKTFGIAEKIPAGVEWKQLWAGGPYFADRNVGASSMTGYGDMISWGMVEDQELVPDVSGYVWTSYEWYKSRYIMTKYTGPSGDGLSSLLPEDDAAYWNWGGNCRIPTPQELQALIENTNYEWTTIDNVPGVKFTDKNNADNFIFLPASGDADWKSLAYRNTAGCYWTNLRSTRVDPDPDHNNAEAYAYFLRFYDSDNNPQPTSPDWQNPMQIKTSYRYDGFPIRVVRTNL